jgi:hypothetical protein
VVKSFIPLCETPQNDHHYNKSRFENSQAFYKYVLCYCVHYRNKCNYVFATSNILMGFGAGTLSLQCFLFGCLFVLRDGTSTSQSTLLCHKSFLHFVPSTIFPLLYDELLPIKSLCPVTKASCATPLSGTVASHKVALSCHEGKLCDPTGTVPARSNICCASEQHCNRNVTAAGGHSVVGVSLFAGGQ